MPSKSLQCETGKETRTGDKQMATGTGNKYADPRTKVPGMNCAYKTE